jgi:hypothetical protein
MASSSGLPTRDPLHPILDTYHQYKESKKDAYLGLDLNGNLICKVYEKRIFSSRPKTIENEFDLRNGSGERIIIKVDIDRAVPDKKIEELTRSIFSYSPQKKESGYKSASARSREESPVLVSTPSAEPSISEEFEIVERPLDADTSYKKLAITYEKLYNICERSSEISEEEILDLERETISYKSLKEVLHLFLEGEVLEEHEGLCRDIDRLICKINEKLNVQKEKFDVQNFANRVSGSIMESSLKEVATLRETAAKEQAANTLMDPTIDKAEEKILEQLLDSYVDQVIDERIQRSKEEFKQINQAIRSITTPDLEEFLSDAEVLKALSFEDEILEDTADSSFIEKLTDLKQKFGALNSLLEDKIQAIEPLLSSVRSHSFFSEEEKVDLLRLLENKNAKLGEKRKELENALLHLGQLNEHCQQRQLIRKEILEDAIKALGDFQGTPLFSMNDGKLMIEKKGLFASHPSIKIGKKALYFKEANRDEILKLLEFTSVYERQKLSKDGTPIASISPDFKPVNLRLQPLKEAFKELLLEKLS